MAKPQILDAQNPLVTIKALVTSILASLILIVPILLAMWFRNNQRPLVSIFLWVIYFLGYLWIFGWLARKLWKWK